MSTESEETVVESPDETQIEDEATSPEEAGSEEVEVSGDPAAEDVSEAEAEEVSEPEPEEAEPEQAQEQGTPFSFRVSGKDVAVEGANVYEHDDGQGGKTQSVVIPASAWQRNVQPYLQDASATAKERNQLLQQIEALDPTKNETVVRAQSLLDNFEQIIASEESLTEFLTNFDQNKEVLRLKADLAARAAQDELRTSREEAQTSEARQAEILQEIDADISSSASAVFDALNLDISDDHKQRIGEWMWERRTSYYRYATADDARMYPGVTEGEVVFDTDLAAADMQRLAAFAPAQNNTKTEKARKSNKAVLEPKETPKTVPADGSPAPSKEKVVEYKTKEEWERAMGLN